VISKKTIFSLLVGVAGVLQVPGTAAAQEEEAVLHVIQTLFDAMANRDAAAYSAITTPHTRTVAIRVGDSTVVRLGDEAAFLEIVASVDRPAWQERMFEPEVRVEGPLATVWTRYDFHVGGEFSHCGVDSFQMMKTEGTWTILQISYTTVSDRAYCSNLLGRPVR
jgi:hypothetical protein